MDFTAITGAVDFATVVTAILAIGGLMALPAVAKAGARKVLSMIR
jgi:hypothetical protein